MADNIFRALQDATSSSLSPEELDRMDEAMASIRARRASAPTPPPPQPPPAQAQPTPPARPIPQEEFATIFGGIRSSRLEEQSGWRTIPSYRSAQGKETSQFYCTVLDAVCPC